MNNIFKTVTLLTLMGAVFFLNSCQKGEVIEPTPFWKILQGNWQIQKNYTINGQNFEMSDIEATTILSLFENVTDDDIEISYSGPGYHDNGYYSFDGEKFLNDDKKFDNIQAYLRLKYKKTSMMFRNREGIYTEYDCGHPELFSNFVSDFFRVFTSQDNYPNPFVMYGFDMVDFQKFEDFNNNAFGPRGVYKAWGRTDLIIYTNVNSSVENFKITDLNNQTNFWADYQGQNQKLYTAFKIENVNSDEIKIIYYTHYYGRIQNSKKIYDTIVFRFKKLNTSSTVITIPPFNIDDYKKSVWEKFDSYTAAKLKNGSNLATDEHVGNGTDVKKSLRLLNYNSYAESTLGDIFQKNKTLSFWVNPESVDKPKQNIFSKYRNQYGPYVLSLEGNRLTIELNDGNGVLQKVQAERTIPKYTWTHIVLTIDENNYGTLYVNGAKDSGGTLNNVDNDADGASLIGMTEKDLLAGQFTNNFKGYIDEVMVIDKVMGAGEIYQLYKWHLTN